MTSGVGDQVVNPTSNEGGRNIACGDRQLEEAPGATRGSWSPLGTGAQELDLAGFADARRDVVGRARDGKLGRPDITGGTFTVSNLGMLGIDRFDAILNGPQVAILAVGATTHRLIGNGGDPAWRPIAELTITCDHRAVAGAAGAGFLATLRELLQT